VYYKEAVGALVVFDVTRPSTFEAVVKWKNDLDSKVCTDASFVCLFVLFEGEFGMLIIEHR
jgi:hypothetical protein